jgi:hypothetical protein
MSISLWLKRQASTPAFFFGEKADDADGKKFETKVKGLEVKAVAGILNIRRMNLED